MNEKGPLIKLDELKKELEILQIRYKEIKNFNNALIAGCDWDEYAEVVMGMYKSDMVSIKRKIKKTT